MRKGKAYLLLDPFHALGQGVCAYLSRSGKYPIVVSEDPDRGAAFATRMSLEGCQVAHRTVHARFPDAEVRLAQDLAVVHGGLCGVISFFPRVDARARWLELPLKAANAIVQSSLDRRLRLLRAMAPLLTRGGFLHNVLIGAADPADASRLHAGQATANLWDDLMADEWAQRGVAVRWTRTKREDGTLHEDLAAVLADLKQCAGPVGLTDLA